MLKKWTLLWREAHLEVKMNTAQPSWATFGSLDVEAYFDVSDVVLSTDRWIKKKIATCMGSCKLVQLVKLVQIVKFVRVT